MAKDLFSSAQKTQKSTAASKDKELIDVNQLKTDKGELKFPEAAQLLVDFQKYHAQAAEAAKELKTRGAQLKEIGLELWINKFEETGLSPESFKLTGTIEETLDDELVTKTGTVMFVPSDAYKQVDEVTATVLESKYGCINRETTYYFNNELLLKYKDAISRALMNSKAISPEDKDKLILKTESVSIRKGTIDNVDLVESITGKVVKPENPKLDDNGQEIPVFEKFESVAEMVRMVEPTFSLKNC